MKGTLRLASLKEYFNMLLSLKQKEIENHKLQYCNAEALQCITQSQLTHNNKDSISKCNELKAQYIKNKKIKICYFTSMAEHFFAPKFYGKYNKNHISTISLSFLAYVHIFNLHNLEHISNMQKHMQSIGSFIKHKQSKILSTSTYLASLIIINASLACQVFISLIQPSIILYFLTFEDYTL